MRRLLLVIAVQTLASLVTGYGVDCSFPCQRRDLNKADCGGALGDRTRFYQDFFDGCVEAFGEELCTITEQKRLDMNTRQPQSVVNFTATGFTKVRAPSELMYLLHSHWLEHKDDPQVEEWKPGSTGVNHWDVETFKVELFMDGDELPEKIYQAAKRSVEEWTGMEQRPTSLYGIRVYRRGNVLIPHVDRYPLISSVIINVDQDVEEPWPLEVVGRDGEAINVTMVPGDMVLYESHSLIHGRPFALNGTFMANVFCHFEPTGRLLDEDGNYFWKDDKVPTSGGLAPYMVPASVDEPTWWSKFPNGWQYSYRWAFGDRENEDEENDNGERDEEVDDDEDRPFGHEAAGDGDVDKLMFLAQYEPDSLHLRDENGWQPIHEAARDGHLDAVAMLLDHGANVNSLNKEGETPLDLVVDHIGEDHPLVGYLEERGASYGEEL